MFFGMSIKMLVSNKSCFFDVSQGPEGFRDVGDACTIHVHLFWYLSDVMVTSYGQKTKVITIKKKQWQL